MTADVFTKVIYQVTDTNMASCYADCTSYSYKKTKAEMEALIVRTANSRYPVKRKYLRIIQVEEKTSMVYYGDNNTEMKSLIVQNEEEE